MTRRTAARLAAVLAVPLSAWVAVLSPAAGEAAPGGEAMPVLSGTGMPGGLQISNPGARPLLIARAIGVEWLDSDGHWVRTNTEFNAVAACVNPASTGPVRLAPGETLTPVRWRGYSCSGQCNRSCRANIYMGGAPFHFVVTRLPDGARAIGPVFTMPVRPSD